MPRIVHLVSYSHCGLRLGQGCDFEMAAWSRSPVYRCISAFHTATRPQSSLFARFFPLAMNRFLKSDDADHESLFRYDSGRWLWDEDIRLKERYKKFNVQALKEAAAKSVGAQRCTEIIKLAEGGTNRVFRLVMDNNEIVIAKMPMSRAGLAFKATASEVATMDFVRHTRGVSKMHCADIFI